ncbi:colanic acid biosynthesis acetyltransferase WcaF [Sphingobacterium sp. DN00404]|uniref:Colanic acid biosynthesis acetyltransferase WcaF n=1 Tax=Sphingobacterium micropteri TaxID=2763501 RepID=A0ABR7YKG1_9SPHI|nr:WcaF family extracellular polysaccharide biosynthesis acetyltransferase [Sphingobacterium micropteri]MBD1431820.1 colanic acid biosynthesis acetyltransferase WcaF [Sphingobacterium micropteri]
MKHVDLSTYNNDFYRPGNRLKVIVWYFFNVLFFINPLNPSSYIKVLLLRSFGAKIGKGVTIKPGVNIKYPWKLKIGDHVWIGEKVWIDNLADVIIMDNVCVSQGAMLLCGNHNYKKTSFDLIVGSITLETGSWVGAKAVVCPNVTVAEHSIIAVNSVLNRSSEKFGIYQGNPALKIRVRFIN